MTGLWILASFIVDFIKLKADILVKEVDNKRKNSSETSYYTWTEMSLNTKIIYIKNKKGKLSLELQMLITDSKTDFKAR